MSATIIRRDLDIAKGVEVNEGFALDDPNRNDEKGAICQRR